MPVRDGFRAEAMIVEERAMIDLKRQRHMDRDAVRPEHRRDRTPSTTIEWLVAVCAIDRSPDHRGDRHPQQPAADCRSLARSLLLRIAVALARRGKRRRCRESNTDTRDGSVFQWIGAADGVDRVVTEDTVPDTQRSL